MLHNLAPESQICFTSASPAVCDIKTTTKKIKNSSADVVNKEQIISLKQVFESTFQRGFDSQISL